MALRCSRSPRSRPRFPRPRGDGPATAAACARVTRVPPPTRGWPAATQRRGGRRCGSPAHAGMAPHRHLRGRCRHGFPRPRGDGPVSAGAEAANVMVPPPTRGWPSHTAACGSRVRGSPAHAGMAPGPARPTPAAPRFPRPRGDGPIMPGLDTTVGAVPPPTRGWPHGGARDDAGHGGSPAHAGMALLELDDHPPPHRFPRPRGDGPPPVAHPWLEALVPPPTRGWPPPCRCACARPGGSPAHAGMALCTLMVVGPPASVPPPTRGWPGCLHASGLA